MILKLTKAPEDIRAAAEIMQQLRSHLSVNDIIDCLTNNENYQLCIARNTAQDVVGVMGFHHGLNLAWGAYIYVDDLVVDQNTRSTGVGQHMLQWLKAYGAEINIQHIHLDSGVQRFGAHKFYLNAGFVIASHHFSHSL